MFDFTEHAPGGVTSFVIRGIDVPENLDPRDPFAFVTGLKFVDGSFLGEVIMTPLTKEADMDTTAPRASPTHSPASNAAGWRQHRRYRDVELAGQRRGLRIAAAQCTSSTVSSGEGNSIALNASCSDVAGNTGSASYHVSVDKTPPTVLLNGGLVNGSSYQFDNVPTAPTCSASDGPSGLAGGCAVSGYSTAVGTHTVTATAADKAGNRSTSSITYTVTGVNIDLMPPTLTVPGPLVVNATDPTGVSVSYLVTATDTHDPNPAHICAPASGAKLPIGHTTVTCTATDRAGNSTTASFPVHVKGAAEQLNDLWLGVINDSRLSASVKTGLAARIQVALAQFDPANPRERRLACASMSLFISLVQAQSWRNIPQVRANQLIADAKRIRDVLGAESRPEYRRLGLIRFSGHLPSG